MARASSSKSKASKKKTAKTASKKSTKKSTQSASKKVTKKKSAARKATAKSVSKKKASKAKASSSKRSTKKKVASKKSSVKKAAKKSASKKLVSKKSASKKSSKKSAANKTAKTVKAATKKSASKKAAKKKATSSKASSKAKATAKTVTKAAASKEAATKKVASKKAATKKATTKKATTKKATSKKSAVAGDKHAEGAVAKKVARPGATLIKVNTDKKNRITYKPPPTVESEAEAGKPMTVAKLKRCKSGLSKKEKDTLHQMLLEKRREIIGDIQSLDNDASQSAGELSNMPVHMADVGTDSYDREFTLGLMERDRKQLRDIEEALERIREGYYGVCIESGEPIGFARLEFKPWAKYCIAVAQERERLGLTE